MHILIDVTGLDKGISTAIEATLQALKTKDFTCSLYGPEKEILEILGPNYNKDRINIVNCTETILNTDEAALAIRRKKDSAIVKGLKAMKAGEGDGFISGSSTGAILAGATLITGRLEGLDRAALTVILPGLEGPMVMLDVGANMDASPELLFQFAKMGSVYAKTELSVENPKLAILNVGTEEGKGNALTKELYKLLKDSNLNFIGSVEARDVLSTKADVLVSDGFSGNVCLKSIEGTAQTIVSLVNNAIMTNLKTKLAGLALKKDLKEQLKKLDYNAYGACPMLGVKQAVFKAHGSSNVTAFKNGILSMIKFIDSDTIGDIKKSLLEDINE